MMRQISVCISGSFHRHINAIEEAVLEFQDRGVNVLSPKDPRIVDSIGTFLFVASDKHKSIRLVQDAHLSAISISDFLWLVSPDNYVGPSATFELGYACAYSVPIYSENIPPDLTLRKYIQKVDSIDDAIFLTSAQLVQDELINQKSAILNDPPSVIEGVHQKLETVDTILKTHNSTEKTDVAKKVYPHLNEIKKSVSLPSPT